MVAYAFDLEDLHITDTRTTYTQSEHGLIDLLGIALHKAVRKIARNGLQHTYRPTTEDLSTPRGRMDFYHIATHAPSQTLRCTFDTYTTDHELNQVLAAGLRLSANVMVSRDLRIDLARSADSLFGDTTRIPLSSSHLDQLLRKIDRTSSHYRTALTLIALIFQGSRVGNHADPGEMPLSSFTLDMNMLFEKFLGKYLVANSPEDVRVHRQHARSDAYSYIENPARYTSPSIRPDFVFESRGGVVAIGDAKYKNRLDHPPTTAELYQLTVYGLSYIERVPREVLLFHPVSRVGVCGESVLLFRGGDVRIRVVGVGLDELLESGCVGWWPGLGVVSGSVGFVGSFSGVGL